MCSIFIHAEASLYDLVRLRIVSECLNGRNKLKGELPNHGSGLKYACNKMLQTCGFAFQLFFCAPLSVLFQVHFW